MCVYTYRDSMKSCGKLWVREKFLLFKAFQVILPVADRQMPVFESRRGPGHCKHPDLNEAFRARLSGFLLCWASEAWTLLCKACSLTPDRGWHGFAKGPSINHNEDLVSM